MTARKSPPKELENGAEFGNASNELDIEDKRLRGGGGIDMWLPALPVAINGNAGGGGGPKLPDRLTNGDLCNADDGAHSVLLTLVLSLGLRAPITSWADDDAGLNRDRRKPSSSERVVSEPPDDVGTSLRVVNEPGDSVRAKDCCPTLGGAVAPGGNSALNDGGG